MNPQAFLDLLPFDVAFDDLMIVFAGLAVMLTIIVAGLPFVEKERIGNRMKALKDHKDALANRATQAQTRGLNEKAQGAVNRIVTQSSFFNAENADELRLKLAGAGIRSKQALNTYMFAKVFLPLIFGAFGALFFLVANSLQLELNMNLLLTGSSALLGFFAPNIYVKNATDKRKILLLRAIPDALDLMVICAEAGLNMDTAFKRVAREVHDASPDLADEFELTSIELGFMSDRRTALNNLGQRTQVPGMEALTSTLIQSEKYGTPLAETLRVLATEMRDERMLKAEEKAAKLPATLTVPMILFILPPLFVVLIGPAILNAIDAISNL